MRGPMLAVGGALTGLGVLSIKAASDLEQSIGAVDSIFGEAADTIHAFGKTSSDSLALSRRAFNEAVVPLGAMMKNAGVEVNEVANRMIDLSKVAADMAATHGGTVKDALDALGAAFRGEADPIERYGLTLNASRINAKAMAMGLAETSTAIDATSRAAAFMELVMEQTTDIQGQFGRESDSIAQKTQRMTANIEDLNAALGIYLIPYATKAVDQLNKMLDTFERLPEGAKKAIVFVMGFVAALVLLGLVLSPILTVGSVVAGIAGAIGAAFGVAGGIVLLIVGILLALVGAVWFVWRNWDTVWGKIKDGSHAIWAAIGGPILVLITLIVGIVKAIVWVWKNWDTIWNLIKTIFNNVVDAIGDKWNDVWEGMKNATRTAVNAIIGLVNGMIGGVEAGINAIIDAINSIPDINIAGKEIGIPDIPDAKIPRIPMLAEGGIVKSPTLAMIGERGPEAVIPLDRGMSGNVTNNINVTINGSVDSPARVEQLAAQIARELRLNNRRGVNVGATG